MFCKRSLIAIAILALTIPAWAEPDVTSEPIESEDAPLKDTQPNQTNKGTTSQSGSSNSSDIGWRGWGLRAGVADDYDQVVGGAHFNLGEFVPHLRFQPDVQLGAGDDHTTLFATAPVYYRFGTETRFTPYAGGGISLGWVDHDHGKDDTEFETGGKVTGGLEWPKANGQAFFVELSIGFGDVHDLQALAAWTF